MYIGEKYSGGRYTVLLKLGWGHFSTVWLVVDNKTGAYGAMKVWLKRGKGGCCCMGRESGPERSPFLS